jgi:hypothetical protein
MVWTRRWRAFSMVVCLAVSALLTPSSQAAPRQGGPVVASLELQVDALEKIRDLDLTPDQCVALKKQAAGAATRPAAHPETAPGYRAALTALRDALAEGDDDKISDARDKVEQIQDEQMMADVGPDIEPTEAACKVAPHVLATLSASQVAGYISEHSDDVPDAWKTMLDALEQARDKPADYAALREEATRQVALLLVGVDRAAGEPIEQKVGQWLDRAHAMSDEDFKAKRTEVEETARQIVGHPDPFDQVRHWMQREVADLLSNPELGNAIDLMK